MQWILDKYNRLLDTRAMPLTINRSALDQLFLQFDQSLKALYLYHNGTQLEMFFIHPLVFTHEIIRKDMRVLFCVKSQLDGSVAMKFRVRFSTPDSVMSFCKIISDYIDVKAYTESGRGGRGASSGASSVVDLTEDTAASQQSNRQLDDSILSTTMQSSSSTVAVANSSTYSLPVMAHSTENKSTQTDANDENVDPNNNNNVPPNIPSSSASFSSLSVHIENLFAADAAREFGNVLRHFMNGVVSGKKMKRMREPGLPKKPLSSFFLFLGENRDRIAQQIGVRGGPALFRAAGEEWSTMSNEEKEHWKMSAATDKIRYQQEMDDYEKSKK